MSSAFLGSEYGLFKMESSTLRTPPFRTILCFTPFIFCLVSTTELAYSMLAVLEVVGFLVAPLGHLDHFY